MRLRPVGRGVHRPRQEALCHERVSHPGRRGDRRRHWPAARPASVSTPSSPEEGALGVSRRNQEDPVETLNRGRTGTSTPDSVRGRDAHTSALQGEKDGGVASPSERSSSDRDVGSGGSSGGASSDRPAGSGSATPGGPDRPLPPIAREEDRGFYNRVGKRALDAVAAGLALLLLSPLFALIAAAIKLDSPGPVFYRSSRVGVGGRLFVFYKFRSMVHGADRIRDLLQDQNEADGPVFKIARDPRITRVGRVLRRTSLDELPQIWNILKGEMSLVGPRPPIPREVLQYEPWQLRRLAVRPGLTCLWQISGRSEIGFDEWMRLDMEYIDHRSFLLDLKILLRTVPAVMSGKGAY